MTSPEVPDWLGLTAHSSVDQVMDKARFGFKYFEGFTPVYASWRPERIESVDDLRALLEQQRGLDDTQFDTAAEQVAHVVAVASDQVGTQRIQAGRLRDAWTGRAADAAGDTVAEQATHADTLRSQTDAAAKALSAVGPALRSAVLAKATVTVGFLEDAPEREHSLLRIRGLGPEEIARFVAITKEGVHGASDLELLGRVFGELMKVAIEIGDGDDLSERVDECGRALCTEWLNGIFKPDYESKLDAFRSVCESTDQTIRDVYAHLTAALDGVDNGQFPTPTVTAPDRPSQSYPQSGAVASSGGGTSPGIATGMAAIPDAGALGTGTPHTGSIQTPLGATTAPTALTSTTAAAGLTGVIEAAKVVGGVVGGVLGGVVDGAVKVIDELTTPDDEEAGESGPEETRDGPEQESAPESQKADDPVEFRLGDFTVTIEAGADGALTLNAAGPDGDTKGYTLRLDENGVPVVTPSEDATDATDDAAVPVPETQPADPAVDTAQPEPEPAGERDPQFTGPPVVPPRTTVPADEPVSPAIEAIDPDTGAAVDSDDPAGVLLAEAGPM